MCGICGEVNFGPSGPVPEKVMSRMLDKLIHRGPDDAGIFRDRFSCLGHRRLSIIDLSENGHQPMSNEDESIWIVFNGEIYNFQELMDWLKKKGHVFRSRTDSEVIVHLYEELNEEFVNRLNGMFSFALWDSRKEKLVLARDRIGVKPLVYYSCGEKIVFSSEIKALLPHPAISKEIDWEGVELFFTFNFIPAPWTIYKEIKKLSPGCLLIFDKAGLKIKKYWDLSNTTDLLEDEDEAIYRLRELVKDACRMRLVSDVPLGAFLSGGFDSSVVVANMALNSSRPVNTYFIRYGNDPLFDESSYARAVASMYGTNHVEIDLSPEEGMNHLPRIVSSFDEPFADSSAIPTYLVCSLARRHVTVALSGDGGDEIFGGYRRYLGEAYVKDYLRIPLFVRERLIKPFVKRFPDSKGNKWLEYSRRLKIFVDGASEKQERRHYSWVSYFPERDRYEVFKKWFVVQFNSLGYQTIKYHYDSYQNDDLNRMLYADFKNILPFDMLTKVDWMSMQNSLEVRSPLLDYRIAELAFNLPGSLKVRKNGLKYIFKKAFKEYLPDALWGRKKQGFEVPVGEWLREKKVFQNLFWKTVNYPEFEAQDLFNLDKVKSLFSEHLSLRRDNSHKLWAIFVFQWWYQNTFGTGNTIG